MEEKHSKMHENKTTSRFLPVNSLVVLFNSFNDLEKKRRRRMP